MPESAPILSSTNWWGIAIATMALALFFSAYSAYRHSWAGRQYRQGSAAPAVGYSALGGRPWWRHRIEILPLFVALCYLGVICSFVGRSWSTILAVWWFVSAGALAWFFWVSPIVSRKREAGENIDSDLESRNPKGGSFPKGDEADYVIVSPYEKVDSDQRPWWKPRRRE